jgi:uncharacterized protein (TIGR02001 family)
MQFSWHKLCISLTRNIIISNFSITNRPDKGVIMKHRHSKKSIRKLAAQLALPIAAMSLLTLAHAEDLEPNYTFAYNVGAVSDYRVRGISQTSYDPALQGGIDFTHQSGVYLGTAFSNVKWVKDFNGATKGNYEVDLYGGYRGQFAGNMFSYDVGVINYRYPGNNSGVGGAVAAGTFSNANTVEVYGALTYQIYTFKYNRSVGNFLGNQNSSGSQYFDLSAAIDLTNGFTLTPHVGRQLVPNQIGSANYTDYSLTLSKDLGSGFTGTIAAIGTNASKGFYTDTNGKFIASDTLTIGVKYSF